MRRYPWGVSSVSMSEPKPIWSLAKSIVSVLLRIAISPWARLTALIFSIFLVILFGLVFGLGFPRSTIWKLAAPLLFLSAALSFRIGLRRLSAEQDRPDVTGHDSPHVYDKAKYHYDGDFPKGLPEKQAFVHTGMFIGWLIEQDMISADFLEETRGFKDRKVTGANVYEAWDGCLASDELTAEGNRFAMDYFEFDRGKYLDDYEETLAKDLATIYHVADTWENYEAIRNKIDQRYEAWKKKNKLTND
jgi:hypothetical protein